MPPLKLYTITSKRQDREDYNNSYEFSSAEEAGKWLTEKCKCHPIQKYHIINYINGRVKNNHFNVLCIALDYYDIKSRKVKKFPKDFKEGRLMQSQVE